MYTGVPGREHAPMSRLPLADLTAAAPSARAAFQVPAADLLLGGPAGARSLRSLAQVPRPPARRPVALVAIRRAGASAVEVGVGERGPRASSR